MTVGVFTRPTRSPILVARYNVGGSRTVIPVPTWCEDQVSVNSIMARGPERSKTFIIRRAGTPRPEGATTPVIVLIGGRHQWDYQITFRDEPWYSRLIKREINSFVVWGQMTKEGGTIFDTIRPVRSSSGRGVVYSCWPDFDNDGNQTGYRWALKLIEFRLHSSGVRGSDRVHVSVDDVRGETSSPDRGALALDFHYDRHWMRLIDAAKTGFDAKCSADLPLELVGWQLWFGSQRYFDMLDRDRGNEGFCDRIKDLDYLAAFDRVKQAWQIQRVLDAFGWMFPDLPVNPGVESRCISNDARIRQENRLMEAYFIERPERRELLERWLRDYTRPVAR
jgi:hypothetical protein